MNFDSQSSSRPQIHSPTIPSGLAAAETRLDENDDSSPERTPDLQHLIANYQSLIRNRQVDHPVRFMFVRELGRGRQGVVFLAIRHGGRTCTTRHALKFHDPSIYSSAATYWDDMTRIASQITKLQPIQCASLVTRETYDEYKGIGCIQMTAIDGVDLQYLIEGTHLAIARGQSSDKEWTHFMHVLFRIQHGRVMLQPGLALHILRRILTGLTVMHEAGFLHSDVKPSNVMIDRMGAVKLVDFGRAVIIGEPISILLGSPFYMAPETHRLEPGLAQSDIYGTGLVGIELLGGQPLLDCAQKTEAELLEHKMGLVQRLESMLPSHIRTDAPLVATLKRFIDPDPARRFATAEEAADSDQGLRGIHRNMALLSTDAEYDRELELYFEKIADPETGRVNPRLT
jgi:serine/threonine protein kinase